MTRVLAISGSTRDGSTNTAVLRTALDVAPEGVEVEVYDGLRSLPHFDPGDDRDPLPPKVADLRDRLAASDVVLICTPEYAGALPGSFKNLLDWTVGGGLYRHPVAWINASASATGAAGAHASLATVLRYVDADVVQAACREIMVGRPDLGADGLVTDPGKRADIRSVLVDLDAHVSAVPKDAE